ncbi:NAD-dependent epimerase/dehydratase family protein [Cyanobium sp. ATX 6A2]|uniref:NAD-dependent epimerase/dehydratase family protein n=1 Tax=Cyanobium sp. ATX 6A2 TaxID=2823700 RepID=UPI0020CCEE8F|nr:NAD-dependent epimerase/dehydratase family protein [Cyanobium sp. ATX 6A2]MCP9888691.1 NAD-dependent epimerase/dehydratase family protein [Cyanobium sp. ATX 6A2]
MRILITGACGFVGSEVALALQEHLSGVAITGLDNLSRRGSWRNLERLEQRGIRVLHGDIRQAADLEGLEPHDWLIDAAANPSVLAGVDGKASSRQLVEHNLLGTVQMLEACKRWGAGFVLLSTSRVYSIPPLAAMDVKTRHGAFTPTPYAVAATPGLSEAGISEAFSTAAPVSLYGATKLASEALALEYGEAFGLPVWINRCGVLAGAGQFGKADQGIFAYWLHSWREQRPLRYIGFDGQGHQVRDCLHPQDLARLLALQVQAGDDQRKPRLLNVAGGIETACSLQQLSCWCSERWGVRAVAQSPEPRPYDLPWVVLDQRACRDAWGWQPQISRELVLEEIAVFADGNPNWIALSA